jgi:4-amino-4-deoxy-L-arabinose transferase-like glycosyltransferase
MAAILGAMTFVLHGYRLHLAPDIFSDEASYLLVSRNLAGGLGLVGDTGPFFWHPPVYIMVQAAYLRAAGLLSLDVVDMLFAARWLNVFFSACTAGLLVLLGRKVHGLHVGLLMGGLFLLDPFVQRINRRAMLETLALFLALLGIYLFFTYRSRVGVWREVACGLAFGLAVLTKELVAFYLLAVPAFALWSRREHIGAALRVTGFAVATYLLYPVWAFASGHGEQFLAYRVFGVHRYFRSLGLDLQFLLIREIRLPPGGRPPFWENVLALAGSYATTIALLGAGAVATLVLLMWYRRLLAARYVATWGVISYLVGGTFVVARVGDQYFYFVVVAAIAVTAYAALLLVSPAISRLDLSTDGRANHRFGDPFAPRHATSRRRWLASVLVPVFVLVVAYDLTQWVRFYGVGVDNSYARIYEYVTQHVPPGETIVVGTDVANYLLKPEYDIQFYRDQRNVQQRNVRYFILSTKEPWGRYNAVTPEFYAWVMGETRPLIEVEGPTFWKIGVYYRDLTPSAG